MKNDRSERGAAHARVGNTHHVFYALLRELPRYGYVSCFGHARRAFRACVLENEHVLGGDIERRIIDTIGEVFERFEHDSAPGVAHQLLTCGGLLDDRTAWREVTAQHRDAAFLENRRAP